MKSMTGYGKATCELPDKKVTIEVKSVNSKQLDLNIKLPAMFRDKETEVRSLISKQLERGKIDCYINLEQTHTAGNFSLNKEQAVRYHEEIKQLSEELALPMPEDILPLLVRMPDVVKTPVEELNDNEWAVIFKDVEKAVRLMDEFRLNEGNILKNDMAQRISLIQQGIQRIEPFEKDRILQIRQRIQTNIAAAIAPDKIDNNRLEQELIYFLEKMDFTEEKVRLQKHCAYFLETMKEDVSNGRKLGFITQEIGREINTLGSKANDSNIQKIVIEMKDELEKIREQLLNVL